MARRILIAVVAILSAQLAAQAQTARSTFTETDAGWTLTGIGALSQQPSGGHPGGLLLFDDGSDLPPELPDEGWAIAPAAYLGNWSSLDGVGTLSWDQVLLATGEGVLPLDGRAEISGPGGAAYWQAATNVDLDWRTFNAPINSASWVVTSGSWSGILANVTELRIRIEGAFNTSGTLRDSTAIDNVVLAAPGSIIRVDANATGIRTGASWTDAFRYLEDALSVAKPTDEIWVADGVYTPARPDGDRLLSFPLRSQMGLYGGFAGGDSVQYIGGETQRAQRDTSANVCVLSGDLYGDDGAGFVNYVDNSYHVLTAVAVDATCVLDGFVIRGGNATSADPESRGGGIYLQAATISIANCRFEANLGMYGGAIGGWSNSHALLTNCVLVGNRAAYGGAVYCDHSNPTLVGVSFIANSADLYGGGLYNDQSTPTLVNCLLVGNSAVQNGGAVRDYNSSSSQLINCSMANNVAGTAGAGMSLLLNSNLRLANCILWNNSVGGSSNQATQINMSGNSLSPQVSYTCVQGWNGSLGGTGNSGASPSFRDLDGADDVAGNADDDLHLLPASPFIDAGNNVVVPAGVTTDLDGGPRFLDDLNIADTGAGIAPIVDRGAYEAAPTQTFLLSTTSLTVGEQSSEQFTVRLLLPPIAPLQASVTRLSGDTDLSVTGGSLLNFDAGNYATPQPVTISAADDPDHLNGSAVFQVSAPGLPSMTMTATEQDADPLPPRLYVDRNATGDQTGESWANAMTELHSALTIASLQPSVVEIWVACGTYKPGELGNRDATFNLLNGLALYGGFGGVLSAQYPGGETSLDQRDLAANCTILSGDLGDDDGPNWANISDNSNIVITAVNVGSSAIVDGFTITGGNNTSTRWGGGLAGTNASPTVRNCRFIRNRSSNGGGAISISGGSATIASCTFQGNHANGNGGGLAIVGGAATVSNSSFSGNTGGQCGGVYLDQASSTLTNCLFTGNNATEYGGAIRVWYWSNLTLNNCTIARSTMTNSGGSIYITYHTTVTINNCILWGSTTAGNINEAAQLYEQPGSNGVCTITSCTIQGWTGSLGGMGNNALDPLFVDVDGADNVVGTLDDDARLLVGSSAIDSGSNSLVPVGVTVDLAGAPRLVDDPATTDTGLGTAPLVDRGAYESPANQDFLLDGMPPLTVPEGATAQFTVRLAKDPLGPVSATVSVVSGDTDISVSSGLTLNFDSHDWSMPHIFELTATEDADWLNSQAVVRIQFEGAGLAKDLTALEQDNDPVPFRVYVDSAAVGENTGASWANAFTDLRTALAMIASRPDVSEIWVAAGTYKPAPYGGARNSAFRLSNNLALYGGFAGGDSTQYPGGETSLEQRDWLANPTILSGDLNGNDTPTGENRVENSLQVVVAQSVNETAILDGFTIESGYHNIAVGGDGGGMAIRDASPQVLNCRFRKNYAQGDGGAMVVISGTPAVRGCTFDANNGANGGAVNVNTSSSATFTDCRFLGNTAGWRGGGCLVSFANPIFVNCLFSGNTALDTGGAIHVWTMSTATMTNCTLSYNHGRNNGGGIYMAGVKTTVQNCILWGNYTNTQQDEYAQFASGGGTRAIHYSCVQGWTGVFGGTGNFSADPRFVDADGADNTMGTLDDDLRLRVRSRCLDAGKNSYVPAAITTDLIGAPRITDDPSAPDLGNGTAPFVDLGAYESPPHQDIVVSQEPVSVPEAGTTVLNVWLAIQPAADLTVQASLASGEVDLTLSDGQVLQFSTSNWSTPQQITLAAAADADWFNGQTWLVLLSPELPDLEAREVLIVEADDAPLPTRLFVDRLATGASTGLTWQDAFVELRDALAAAATRPGVPEIWVAKGTYTPGPAGDRSQRFSLANNLSLYGGFAGLSSVAQPGGETDLSQRDIVQNPTILSGDLAGDDGADWSNRTDNVYHVVTAVSVNSSAVLDGFTISGGMADQSSTQMGGGLYCQDAGPTIRNCRFIANRSAGNGGGSAATGSGAPTFLYCTFIGNSALIDGGGLAHHASQISQIISCRFLANHAVGRGGAGFFYLSECKLTNCLFSGNAVGSVGGALATYSNGKITLTNCTLSNNTAATAGGGIHHSSTGLTVLNSILWGNKTSEGTTQAAQLYRVSGWPSPVVRYCDVQGWTGSFGGVANFGADPRFILPAGADTVFGTEDDNCRLQITSPCIEAGDNTAIPAGITADLDGLERLVLDNVDLGAYEYAADGPISVMQTVSRMVHGTGGSFDIDLLNPLPAQLRAVECRAGGPVKIIVNFSRPIYAVDELDPSDVSLTAGTVSNLAISNRQLTIDMSGTADRTQLKITFPGIRDGAGNPVGDQVCFNVLSGDADGNCVVNVFDMVAVRNALNATLTTSNFRADSISDGVVNILDLVRVRNNLNVMLPQQCQ